MGFEPYSSMKPAYTNIRLNGALYTKEILLQRCSDIDWFNSLNEEMKQIYLFMKEWLNEQDAIVVSTSGSTGNPKTINLRKEQMINSALMTQHFFQLDEKTTALLCLPVNFIAGKMMIVRAFITGCNLATVPPSANPFKKVNQIIDFTAVTPYQLYHSLKDIKRLNIRQMIVGGGAISAELEKKLTDIAANIYATYGMTETCSHVALRKANGKNATDIYSALENISFKQDNRNCLVIEAPALAVKNLVTNDVVELIDNTHFRWMGRYDNVINTGGIKVFPEVVEKKLYGLMNRSFFISSIKDGELSEKVVIAVEGKSFGNRQETMLKKAFAGRLAMYEIPKCFLYIDKFICSESEKILRKKTLQKIILD